MMICSRARATGMWFDEQASRFPGEPSRRTLQMSSRSCGAAHSGLPHRDDYQLSVYLPVADLAASILAFTASRLKLAPFCIGGNSMAVMASFCTCCWTNTKRQNSYLNHWKYSCDPVLVP